MTPTTEARLATVRAALQPLAETAPDRNTFWIEDSEGDCSYMVGTFCEDHIGAEKSQLEKEFPEVIFEIRSNCGVLEEMDGSELCHVCDEFMRCSLTEYGVETECESLEHCGIDLSPGSSARVFQALEYAEWYCGRAEPGPWNNTTINPKMEEYLDRILCAAEKALAESEK